MIVYYKGPAMRRMPGEADNDGDEALREAQERLAERLQAWMLHTLLRHV